MRIAMVGPFGFHPKKTMHSRALSLARELVQRGHVVRLFMPPWHTPNEADREWVEDNVSVRYVPLRGGVLGITRRLIRETLAWEPDLVHCFKPKAYSGLTAWWLWQFHHRQLPLIMDTDDWEGWGGWNDLDPYSPLQKHFFAWQEQWGLRHCHLLTVASRALETAVWSLGIPPERVLYLPNGSGIRKQSTINNQQSTNNELRTSGNGHRPTLLLYSRLFEFDTARLVAVLRGVKTAVPDLKILSIGAGLHNEDAVQLQQQLKAASLWDSVVDLGWVETEQLSSVLTQGDVGLYLMEDTLLNRTKCPVKLVDMLSVGVPVVAEAVGQVPEYVVNGRSGLLRPSGDVDGLVADLTQLLTNQALSTQLAIGAKAHISEHFAWSILAGQLDQAYHALLKSS
ncbi:MAG: glycosyltransferase family 4 protein [Chloroflexi bacterium]|nr:glycosyltransferase family 4 protein [Chloroflexota bacterium]